MAAISIKGRRPRGDYGIDLLREFGQEYRPIGTMPDLRRLVDGARERFHALRIEDLEPVFRRADGGPPRDIPALPCAMGRDLEKRDFNLNYQDVRLKLAVEDHLPSNLLALEGEKTVAILARILCAILHSTVWSDEELWTSLCDNDLDAIVYWLLEGCFSDEAARNIAEGRRANTLAMVGLPDYESSSKVDFSELLIQSVRAGTVWWLQQSSGPSHETERHGFRVDDSNIFLEELERGPERLIFLADDNGELVWDLVVLDALLARLDLLRVTLVANSRVISNNASRDSVETCLATKRFERLRASSRFNTWYEEGRRSSIDMRFCSDGLLELLRGDPLIYAKGVGAFETFQNVPAPIYYGFEVHSHNSQVCTGLNRGSAVFVRVREHSHAYSWRKVSLMEYRDEQVPSRKP